MSIENRIASALITVAVALSLGACDQQQPNPAAPSAQSAATTPTAAAATSATAPAPTASAAPVHDCPAGSTGEGTSSKPCDGKGTSRMVHVAWTGKITDGGPSFRLTSKSPSVIVYGTVVFYYYDKAGKQLEVKDSSGKTHPNHRCDSSLFGGMMKAAERAIITFSCVKKETVPVGTAQIEAEVPMVGFADSTEKESVFFWRNHDLTPDARPKGGVK
jgi:hypothetical protein